MKYSHNKKAQAVVELAIFGSIILVVFGILLSYVQRLNDQQYVQMEAFRRALEKACNTTAGASVQYTLITDRHHADLNGGLGKGSPTTVSASTNVFWAVPKAAEDAKANSLIIFRINEDEKSRSYDEFVPVEHDGNVKEGDPAEIEWSFRTEEMISSSDAKFDETVRKQESPSGITNTRVSKLSESKKYKIPYTVRVEDDDDDDENDVEAKPGGTFWEGPDSPGGELVQRLYRDTDGQYKYSSKVPEGTVVERTRQWQTGF
ncbi:MAG: hypothetical protein PHG40_00625 [Candidatus Omnitrophica bacterium]|nr:hypothetical protein [Candidatus Omnitrophota bacterium]